MGWGKNGHTYACADGCIHAYARVCVRVCTYIHIRMCTYNLILFLQNPWDISSGFIFMNQGAPWLGDV